MVYSYLIIFDEQNEAESMNQQTKTVNFARESRACLQDCMGSSAPPRRRHRVPLQMWNVEQQTHLSWSFK